MGQKISPHLFRAKQRIANTGRRGNNASGDVTSQARSVWFADKRGYSKLLLQDIKLRKYLKDKLSHAGLVEVVIKRYFRRIEINLHVTKPGIVIGKGGAAIQDLKKDLLQKFDLPSDVKINIEEFKDPNRSAQVIAEEISFALKKRVPFRRLAKNFIERIRYSGVLGAKIVIKGRLNGADIARKEEFAFGSVPRHTIDSQIDYANVHCRTYAGVIGIKVFLYKGDKITNYTY